MLSNVLVNNSLGLSGAKLLFCVIVAFISNIKLKNYKHIMRFRNRMLATKSLKIYFTTGSLFSVICRHKTGSCFECGVSMLK